MFLIYDKHLRVDAYDPWKFHSDPSSGLGGDWRKTDIQTDTQTHFGWGGLKTSKQFASLAVWKKVRGIKQNMIRIECYKEQINHWIVIKTDK